MDFELDAMDRRCSQSVRHEAVFSAGSTGRGYLLLEGSLRSALTIEHVYWPSENVQ
jgi:hypothetical protein